MMTMAEQDTWTAIDNLVPKLGKDFKFDVVPDNRPEVYKCETTFTYLTDLGELLVPVIAEKLNGEILKLLATRVASEANKPEVMEKLSKVELAQIKIINGMSGNNEEIAFSTGKLCNIKPKLVKKPVEQTEEQPPETPKEAEHAGNSEQLDNPEPEKDDTDIGELHWNGLFKTYMPNSSVDQFVSFVRTLATVEINKRLVKDHQEVIPMPTEFDKKWLEDLDVKTTGPVYVEWGDLMRPSDFSSTIDLLYDSVKASLKNNRMYNGTLRVLVTATGYHTNILSAIYMTTKENEHVS